MKIAEEIIAKAAQAEVMITTAESCTGGMVIAALTDFSGASKAVDRGFITYSDDAKISQLNVPKAMIKSMGAVSEDVVRAMAEGAAMASLSQSAIAISVSGIAGPDGGTAEKPVGYVWFGLCRRSKGHVLTTNAEVITLTTTAVMETFSGRPDKLRADIRKKATNFALKLLKNELI